MIKKEQLKQVLSSGFDLETGQIVYNTFSEAMRSGGATPYIYDTMRLYSDAGNEGVREAFLREGLGVVESINKGVSKGKQVDINILAPEFLVQTGIMNRMAVIGVDTSKEGEAITSYFTRSEKIIELLYKYGAFGDGYTGENLEKDLKALDNRVLNGIKKPDEEGGNPLMHGLAYARLDIVRVEKTQVELKMVIRGSYRYDIGTSLKFYPAGAMPYIFGLMEKQVKDSPLKIIQKQPDGRVKSRVISFTPKAVELVYQGYEKNLVESKIRKTKVGWDVVARACIVHNLESSLHTIGYSKIRLDRVLKIAPVQLAEIDRSQHIVNYNNLKAHFQTCMKRWRIDEFDSFRGVDLKNQSTKAARIEVLQGWLKDVNDRDLYDMMAAQPELFGDVIEQLGERERNLPKPFKAMKMVELSEEPIKAVEELKHMLRTGIVQLTMTTTKSTNVRTEIVTTNPILLSRMLGKNYVENYESVGVKISYLQKLIKMGRIESGEELQKKIYQMRLAEYIDVSKIDTEVFDKERARLEEGYTPGVGSTTIGGGSLRSYDQALTVVEEGKGNVREYNRKPNPYRIMMKRVYAKTERDYHMQADIRNIIAVEYAPLEQK